eukprot:jgi/Psemu1/302025/fgenesh1_kg.56_\
MDWIRPRLDKPTPAGAGTKTQTTREKGFIATKRNSSYFFSGSCPLVFRFLFEFEFESEYQFVHQEQNTKRVIPRTVIAVFLLPLLDSLCACVRINPKRANC